MTIGKIAMSAVYDGVDVVGMREVLRSIAVAVPAEWKTGNPRERLAYELLSAFLLEDQRRSNRLYDEHRQA